jgi:hypothetical protein
MPRPARPVGTITRGTTHPNRLRRVDRWIVARYGDRFRHSGPVDVVDLGFGASPITTVELASRLHAAAPQARVVGLEIDPARVTDAQRRFPAGQFDQGGFELGDRAGQVALVRAMNVLRQYDEADVAGAWGTMLAACRQDGAVVEGTCDEVGRLASWVCLEAADGTAQPRSLTISLRLAGLVRPSEAAARLPKALIHHNVPGRPIHAFLAALDEAWDAAAPYRDLSARQRWIRTCAAVQERDFRLLDGPARWRLGEITVDWQDVTG